MSKIIDGSLDKTYDLIREIEEKSEEVAESIYEHIKLSHKLMVDNFHEAVTARMYMLFLMTRHYPVNLEFYAPVEERENVIKMFEGKKFKMNQTNHEDGSFTMKIEIVEDEDES